MSSTYTHTPFHLHMWIKIDQEQVRICQFSIANAFGHMIILEVAESRRVCPKKCSTPPNPAMWQEISMSCQHIATPRRLLANITQMNRPFYKLVNRKVPEFVLVISECTQKVIQSPSPIKEAFQAEFCSGQNVHFPVCMTCLWVHMLSWHVWKAEVFKTAPCTSDSQTLEWIPWLDRWWVMKWKLSWSTMQIYSALW